MKISTYLFILKFFLEYPNNFVLSNSIYVQYISLKKRDIICSETKKRNLLFFDLSCSASNIKRVYATCAF